jgi:hypothetical protein
MHTTKASLPSQLPFLPGNVYADPTITRYHKTQILGVKDGAMLGNLPFLTYSRDLTVCVSVIEKTSTLQEPIDHALLQSMREGDPMKLTGVPARKAHENDAIPKIAPKWLKYDKQVGS